VPVEPGRRRAVALPSLLALAAAAVTAQAADQVEVATVAQLRAALDAANAAGGNRTILIADGTYTLTDTLYVNAPGITLAGRSGDRRRVVLQGDAMSATAQVGNVIRVAAKGFGLRDLTVQRSRWHLVQIAGESDADGAWLRDCVLRDSHEQMVKVSMDAARPGLTADGGRIENCLFEYSAGVGPQWYIGGIDALGARDWVVRGNTFRGIASPGGGLAQFAVHFWAGSANALVERNTVLDCDRGIGFGLDGRGNRGGTIRNNMIQHSGAGVYGDVGIALIESPDSVVVHNTVFLQHAYPAAIEYRFAATTNVLIANNLLNRAVQRRDGATTRALAGNLVSAESAWFRDSARADLHLVRAVPGVVDAAETVPGVVDDFDGDPRPQGRGADIGADEHAPPRTPSPPANVRTQ
jgi:hypothetical protein